jgi:hypothetical protein
MDPLITLGTGVHEEVLLRVPVHCSLRSRQLVDVHARARLIGRHAQGEVLCEKEEVFGVMVFNNQY